MRTGVTVFCMWPQNTYVSNISNHYSSHAILLDSTGKFVLVLSTLHSLMLSPKALQPSQTLVITAIVDMGVHGKDTKQKIKCTEKVFNQYRGECLGSTWGWMCKPCIVSSARFTHKASAYLPLASVLPSYTWQCKAVLATCHKADSACQCIASWVCCMSDATKFGHGCL